MKAYESMDAKNSEEQPVRHKPTSQSGGDSEGAVSRSQPLDPPKVLSRIPDVTAAEPQDECVPSYCSGVRNMWSSKLVSGLLFAGSLILFVAALVTFNHKGGTDTSPSNASPKTAQASPVDAAPTGTTMARKWAGGADTSSRQNLSRAPSFNPSADSSVPALNATAGVDRRVAEQPKTAAWGGQPQWPIAGDTTPSNAWNRSAEPRTEVDRTQSSPWPPSAPVATATQANTSWQNQPVAANPGNRPADNSWGKPATAWNNAANSPLQGQATRPVTWNEPTQAPVAVPVQQTAPVTVTRDSGWNTPATYQAPVDAGRTTSAYGDSRSNYSVASRPTATDTYRPANTQSNTYPTGNYPSNNYPTNTQPGNNYANNAYPANGNYSPNASSLNNNANSALPNTTSPANSVVTRNYSTNSYQNANSAAGAYPATTPANGYQNATPVNNYSPSAANGGSQANYSPWGNNTRSTANSSYGNNPNTYPTSPANAPSTQSTDGGTAQFEGGIDKTVR